MLCRKSIIIQPFGYSMQVGLTLVPFSPGAVYTPIQADTRDAPQMVNWGSSSKLGRPAQPSEVASSYIFLASTEAALFRKWSPFNAFLRLDGTQC
jgi:NAD(P)-dependent dehydrogenase (short-subunit alcohol dehydrogenase family)